MYIPYGYTSSMCFLISRFSWVADDTKIITRGRWNYYPRKVLNNLNCTKISTCTVYCTVVKLPTYLNFVLLPHSFVALHLLPELRLDLPLCGLLGDHLG